MDDDAPRLDGADAGLVRRAREARDPLPGTRGFAGELDGTVLRDVLGRRPVFTERADLTVWSFDPADLAAPEPVPAGHARTADGDERLWSLPTPFPTADEGAAIERVRDAVRESVQDVQKRETAVAFSGGVDSAAVAALLDAPCYVVGFPDSHDVAAARSAADHLGVDLRVVELDHDTLERAVPAVARSTGRYNAMDVGIALPLYLAADRVAVDGFEYLAVGQGADELFGGYAKVANAPEDSRVDADTVRGARREVVGTLPAQLERDVLAIRAAGAEPIAPLLDDRVVRAALPLPGRLLADGDERKVALRRAAGAFVPDPVARRDKKAVQYGSLVARELDRLARQAGFKRRMDDHVSKYVASLIDE